MKANYTDGQFIGTLDGHPVRIRQYDRLVTCEDHDPETGTYRLCARERIEAKEFRPSVLFADEPSVLATEAQLRAFGLRGGYKPQFRQVYDGNRTKLHPPTDRAVRPW